MSKVRETRYFTYTKTCSYRRVIEPFIQEGDLLQLDAIRNIQHDKPIPNPQRVDWITHLERHVSDMDIAYMVKKHGPFSKSIVKDFLTSTGGKDFWVKSATVMVNDDEVRKAAAELLHAEGVPLEALQAGEKYVAYLESTPCRRFPQENLVPQWVQSVMDYRTEEEIELGFEPGVLDLVHVLPLDVWRDIEGKKRISRAFEREVERLKNALNVHDDPSFSRKKVMNAIFPRTSGIVGGRQEELTEKNTWVIVDIEQT